MIMSDHGHGGNGRKAVFLNTWLEQHHLLRFHSNTNWKVLPSLVNVAKSVGIKTVPSSVKKIIFRKTQLANKLESSVRFSQIDWRHTRAYSEETPYYPSIWINVHGREPDGIVMPGKEYEEVREDIIEALYKWKDPETGRGLVSKVHKREDVYGGPCVEKLPDLIIEWNLDNGYSYVFKHIPRDKGQRTTIRPLRGSELKTSKSGDHRDYGIFIATGRHIQRRTELQGAEVVDLAPTILHLLGLPVPADMDGKVLTEVFSDAYRARHPVTFADGSGPQGDVPALQSDYTADEQEAIRVRLQGLGYIE